MDCAIWCTNGTNAWRETERHLWSQVPQKLRNNSLLAVTHADLPPVRDALDRVVARLNKEKGDLFRAVVTIGTPVAVRAMEQEPEPDFRFVGNLWRARTWQNRFCTLPLITVAMTLRPPKRILLKSFLPYLENLTGAASTDGAEADGNTVQASLEAALPPLDNPILEDWLGGHRQHLQRPARKLGY